MKIIKKIGCRAFQAVMNPAVANHLEEACVNGNNLRARRCMLYASFMAGRAFSKAYVGYPNKLSGIQAEDIP